MAELVRSVRLVPSNGPTTGQGVAAIAATKALDMGSTVFGLAFVPPLRETNPVASAVFAELGPVPGSLLLSLLALALITLATELGVLMVERSGVGDASALRYLGYGVPSAVSLVAALHNVRLILAAGVTL